MAKTRKFTDDTTIHVNPKSKNTIYEYTGEETAYTFELIPDAAKGYDPQYKTVAVKDNDDLVMTTVFASDNGKIKTVTTTIKGYFTEKSANYTVKYNTTIDSNEPVIFSIKPNTKEGRNGIYGAKYEEFYLAHYRLAPTESTGTMKLEGIYSNHVYNTQGDNKYSSEHEAYNDYIYDMSGNDIYTVTSDTEGGSLKTYDYAGDDYYRAEYAKPLYATDYKGNDTYSYASTSEKSTVFDYAGDDYYATTFASTEDFKGGKLSVQDKAGNDTYESCFYSELDVEDSAGKDTYNVNQDSAMVVTDLKGNDTYKTSYGTKLSVADASGKDSYEILATKSVIEDLGKENDSYTVVECTDMEYKAEPEFFIFDQKGNETYNISGLTFISSAEAVAMEDLSGNDKYNFAKVKLGENTYNANIKNVNMYDAKGNDKYNFTIADENDEIEGVYVIDDNGADTYNLTADDSSKIKNITIDDYKGKDNYSFSRVAVSTIHDYAGSDKYSLSEASVTILDVEGNDKFTLTDSIEFSIYDYAGKDKYTISNSAYFGIGDELGNDNCTITNSAFFDIDDEAGKDKYTLERVGSFYISDTAGNDKFTVTDAEDFEIKDNGGSDTYKLSNCGDGFKVTDQTGNDKYTLKSCDGEIYDEAGNDTYTCSASSCSIYDTEGNDKYTLKDTLASSAFYIKDDAGNDTYNVSLKNSDGFTHIEDTDGNKDSLILSDVKKGNLVFMTDISKDGVYSEYLFVYNRTNYSFVELDDFFTTDDNGITGFGKGRIETVKAGNSKIGKVQTEAFCDELNSLKSEVTGWLSESDYISVNQVLFYGDQEAKDALVAIFAHEG